MAKAKNLFMAAATEELEAPNAPALKAVPASNPLHAQVVALEADLNAAFVERRDEVRGILIAALAREHVLLLGPAGTGKSALANAFCGALGGAQFFQWLLTRFSAPEELFGPVSLSGLKADEYRRVTTGKLPECHVAFLDEIYKANSAVLNSLLTAINERGFDNGTGRTRIPLETVIGASNELAEGPELAALHDRFLLRYWVDYTKSRDSFERLMTMSDPTISATISLAELHAAQAEVEALPLAAGTIDELFALRAELQVAGIVASDRRWRKALRILRAVSWIDGAKEVTTESFPVLACVLWETPDQIVKLRQTVSRFSAPQLAEAQEVFDLVMNLAQSVPPTTSDDYAPRVTAVVRELRNASGRLDNLATECAGRASGEKIATMSADLKTLYKSLRDAARDAMGL